MKKQLLLGIELQNQTKETILENIKKYISSPTGFFHIVSLNPEIMVLLQNNEKYKEIVRSAQIRINDGIGIILASKILGIEAGNRIPGVDLMKYLIAEAGRKRFRVLLIGGRGNLANDLANCYNQSYPEAKFQGISGIQNIAKPTIEEEKHISSIVTAMRPHFVFVAFGSPAQEIWLWEHKELFSTSVCMGVGGSFDYLSGSIQRPPSLVRKLGFEWLYRLIRQPWRFMRQLRLIKFGFLVITQLIHERRTPPQTT